MIEALRASRIWWLLLPAAVLAAWFPLDPYWQSDDLIAVEYASDVGRAMRDWIGPQYGVDGPVWFYRPLITASFALDVLIGGTDPFVSHLGNALAHAFNALLLAVIAGRWLGKTEGLLAGLVFGLAPSHAGSVLWAVGRVDSYTTTWILLTLWWLQAWCEERTKVRWPAVLLAAAALGSKELGAVTPVLAALIGWVSAGKARLGGPPGIAERAALAWRASWPLWLLLPAYALVRFAALGRWVGGYAAATVPEPLDALAGLGRATHKLIDPLAYSGAGVVEGLALPAGAGLLAALTAVGFALFRRRGAVPFAVAWFLCCALPTFQLWPQIDETKSLRQLYLPFAGIAVLVGAGGAIPAALAVLVFALPLADLRMRYEAQHAENRAVHARIVEMAGESDGPMFVSGIPANNADGSVLAFHLGVDRLLAPPFHPTRRPLFALRPSGGPSALRIDQGDERGLPAGTTFGLVGGTIIASLPPDHRLPAIAVRIDGSTDLSAHRLQAMKDGDEAHPRLVVAGHRSPHYRLTLFTATGYLCTVIADDAPPGADGGVDLFDWLAGATYAPAPNSFVGIALEVPIAIDLEPRFPLLVEAGAFADTVAGRRFVPTHAARAFVELAFDRDYDDLIRGELAPR